MTSLPEQAQAGAGGRAGAGPRWCTHKPHSWDTERASREQPADGLCRRCFREHRSLWEGNLLWDRGLGEPRDFGRRMAPLWNSSSEGASAQQATVGPGAGLLLRPHN